MFLPHLISLTHPPLKLGLPFRGLLSPLLRIYIDLDLLFVLRGTSTKYLFIYLFIYLQQYQRNAGYLAKIALNASQNDCVEISNVLIF